MSTQTEQALREALAFDPSTPSLSAEPIIATVHRKRRRATTGVVATGVALAAGAGIAVSSWSDDVAGTVAVPAGVTQVSGTFEIGMDWQMVVDDQGLCLANPDRTVYDCGVNLAFRENATFSWSHEASDPQIYAWVVRDSTATAALEKSQGGVIPAQVYRVSDLDVSIAVATLPPGDGWTRVSRDESGAVTDEVPFVLRNS